MKIWGGRDEGVRTCTQQSKSTLSTVSRYRRVIVDGRNARCSWARCTTHQSNPHNLPPSVVCKTAKGTESPTSKTETSVPSNLTATFISAKNHSEAIIKSRPSFLVRCARSESMTRCGCGIVLSCMPGCVQREWEKTGKKTAGR